MSLATLLYVPSFAIILIYVLHTYNINSIFTKKIIALSATIINLIVSLGIYILYNNSYNNYQFVLEYHNINYFDIYLGVDGISIYFVLLTTIIMPIALLSNWKSIANNTVPYIIIILMLELFLLTIFF